MTCRECLYYKMCDYRKIGRICADFSDKSEWVHLPCKYGDRVFSIIVVGGESMIVGDRVSGFIIVRDTIDIITNFYLDGGEWGYNIFQTHEEAKKALEERRNKK